MASLKLQASGPRGEAVVDPVRVGPHVVSSSQRGLNSTAQGSSGSSSSCTRPTGNYQENKVNIFSDTVVGGLGAGGSSGGGLGALASEYSLALNSPAAHSTVAVDKLVAGAAARNKENELAASRWTDASLAPRGKPPEAIVPLESAAFTIYTDGSRRSPEGRNLSIKGPTPSVRLSAMKAAPEALAASNAFALLEADTAAVATGGSKRPERPLQALSGGRGLPAAADDETPVVTAGRGLAARGGGTGGDARASARPSRDVTAPAGSSGEGKMKMMIKLDAIYPQGVTGPEMCFEEIRAQRYRAGRTAAGAGSGGDDKEKMFKLDAVYPKGATGHEACFEEQRAQRHRFVQPTPSARAVPGGGGGGGKVKMMFNLDAVLPEGPSGQEVSFEQLRMRHFRARAAARAERRERKPIVTTTARSLNLAPEIITGRIERLSLESDVNPSYAKLPKPVGSKPDDRRGFEFEAAAAAAAAAAEEAKLNERRRALERRLSATQELERDVERREAELRRRSAEVERSMKELQGDVERREAELRRRRAEVERSMKELEREVERREAELRRRSVDVDRSMKELEREVERREADLRRRSVEVDRAEEELRVKERRSEAREREASRAEARCAELLMRTAEVEAALLAKEQQLMALDKKLAYQEQPLKASSQHLSDPASELSAKEINESRNRKRPGSILCTPRHDNNGGGGVLSASATATTPAGLLLSGRPPSRKNPRRPVDCSGGVGDLRTPSHVPTAEAAARQRSLGVTPTVNTKFAMDIMQQLFDSSASQQTAQDTLCLEEEEVVADRLSRRLPASTGGRRVPPGVISPALACPFKVYEENDITLRQDVDTERQRPKEAEAALLPENASKPVAELRGATAATLLLSPVERAYLRSARHQPGATETPTPFGAVVDSETGALGFKIFADPSISDDQQPAKGGHDNAGGTLGFKIFADPSISDDQQAAKGRHDDIGRGLGFNIFADPSITDDQQPAKGGHDNPGGAFGLKIFADPSIIDHQQLAKGNHDDRGSHAFKIFADSSADDQLFEPPVKASYSNIKPIGFEIFSDPSFSNKQRPVRDVENVINSEKDKAPKLVARTPGVGSDLVKPDLQSSTLSSRWNDQNWAGGPPVGAAGSGGDAAATAAAVHGWDNLLETDIITDMAYNFRINDPDLTFAPEFHSTQNVKKFLTEHPPSDCQNAGDCAPEVELLRRDTDPVGLRPESGPGLPVSPGREPMENLNEMDSAAKEKNLLRRNLTAIQEVSDEKDSRSNHSVEFASSYGLGFSARSLARRSSPVVHPLQEIREATRETSSLFQCSASHTNLLPGRSDHEDTQKRSEEPSLAEASPLRTDVGAVVRQSEADRSFDGSRRLGLTSKSSYGARETADTPPALEFPDDPESGELDESGIFKRDLRTSHLLQHLAKLPTDVEVEDKMTEDEVPKSELQRYGDHTIVMDEQARHYFVEMADRTNYFTTNLIGIDIKDPYKGRVMKQQLERVMPELQASPDFVELTSFRSGRDRMVFNDVEFLVQTSFHKIRGGFGEVMLVRDPSDNSRWIIKKHKERFPLEFYFLREARKRLQKAMSVHEHQSSWVDVSESVCFARRVYCDSKNSFLMLKHYPLGTMLTFRNQLFKIAEPLAAYIALELLHIIDQLHRVGIIHGDIKPDNVMLMGRFPPLPEDYTGGLPDQRTHVICLIDFGRAIDLRFFGRDACFLSESGVKGFECIEMKAGRPWNFQVDLFNLASTLYAIIKGQYMTITCNGDRWIPNQMGEMMNKRLWKLGSFWRSMLETLINIRSCDPADYPNLAELRAPLESYLVEHRSAYNCLRENTNARLSG